MVAKAARFLFSALQTLWSFIVSCLRPLSSSPASSVESLPTAIPGAYPRSVSPAKTAPVAHADVPSGPITSVRNLIARGLNTISHHEVKNMVEFANEATTMWRASARRPRDFVTFLTRYARIMGQLERLRNKATWATAVDAGVRDHDMQRIANAGAQLGAAVIDAARGYVGVLEGDEEGAFDAWGESDMQQGAFEAFQSHMGAVIAQRDALEEAVGELPLRHHPNFTALRESLGDCKQSILNHVGSVVRTMSQSIVSAVADRIDGATQVVSTCPEEAERATQYALELQAQALATGLVLERDQQQIVRALNDLRQTAGAPPEEFV